MFVQAHVDLPSCPTSASPAVPKRRFSKGGWSPSQDSLCNSEGALLSSRGLPVSQISGFDGTHALWETRLAIAERQREMDREREKELAESGSKSARRRANTPTQKESVSRSARRRVSFSEPDAALRPAFHDGFVDSEQQVLCTHTRTARCKHLCEHLADWWCMTRVHANFHHQALLARLHEMQQERDSLAHQLKISNNRIRQVFPCCKSFEGFGP